MSEKYKIYKDELRQLLENSVYPETKRFSSERTAYISSLIKIFDQWKISLDAINENDQWWKTTTKLYDSVENLLQKDKYKLSKFTLLDGIKKLRAESKLLFKIEKNEDELKEIFELNSDEAKKIKDEFLVGYLNNQFFSLLLKEFEAEFKKVGQNYLSVYDLLIEFNNITCNKDLTPEIKTINAHKIIEAKLPPIEQSSKLLTENFIVAANRVFQILDAKFDKPEEGKSEVENLLAKISLKELKKKDETAVKDWEKFKDNYKNYFPAVFD